MESVEIISENVDGIGKKYGSSHPAQASVSPVSLPIL